MFQNIFFSYSTTHQFLKSKAKKVTDGVLFPQKLQWQDGDTLLSIIKKCISHNPGRIWKKKEEEKSNKTFSHLTESCTSRSEELKRFGRTAVGFMIHGMLILLSQCEEEGRWIIWEVIWIRTDDRSFIEALFSAKIPHTTKDMGCILTAYGNAKGGGPGGAGRQMLSVLMYFTQWADAIGYEHSTKSIPAKYLRCPFGGS